MTTDLEPTTPRAGNLPDRIEYARKLAAAELLPRAFRNNPPNVLIAMEFGDALGIPPIQAMNDIHVIDGRPSASANLIGSLVRRAGHKLRVTVSDEQLVAVAQLIRADDPEFTYEARWDMRKAQQAGLTTNPNWKKHPGAMLRSRAVTEVCRMGAPDALYGVQYAPDELHDMPPAETRAHTITAADILASGEPVDQVTGEIIDPDPRHTPVDDAEDAELVADEDWPDVAPAGGTR